MICSPQPPLPYKSLPSFLRWEFPYVLLRAQSWKCFRVLRWKLTSYSYCIVVLLIPI